MKIKVKCLYLYTKNPKKCKGKDSLNQLFERMTHNFTEITHTNTYIQINIHELRSKTPKVCQR